MMNSDEMLKLRQRSAGRREDLTCSRNVRKRV